MTRPIVAVPRRGATAADRRAVQQANAIRAQAAASQPSMFRDVLAESLRRLVGPQGLPGAAKDVAQPFVNFVQHPGLSTGAQAMAALPIGGMRGAAEHGAGDFLYHATTPEGAAAIQASGHVLPSDVHGNGQSVAWVSADPQHAMRVGQGQVLVRVPRALVPPSAVRSRFGPETYASPVPIPLRPPLNVPTQVFDPVSGHVVVNPGTIGHLRVGPGTPRTETVLGQLGRARGGYLPPPGSLRGTR